MQTTAAPANTVNRRPRLSGSKIEQARVARGLSVTQVAAAVDRSERAVRFWERSNVQPHREVVPRLAEALGVTVNDLLA